MKIENTEIYNADCFDIFPKIPDGSVDMVLCDLPYGVTRGTRWDSVIPAKPLFEEYTRITKSDGAIMLFATMKFAATLICAAPNLFSYDLVWEKNQPTGFPNANRQPLRSHELILMFSKAAPKYNPQGLVKLGRPIVNKGKGKIKEFVYHGLNKTSVTQYKNYPRSVLKFAKENNTVHPTQKPVALLEYLIKTYTNEGELVLDNCMGSGSTGVACVNTNRRFIGIEKEECYFKTAAERIEKAIKAPKPMELFAE